MKTYELWKLVDSGDIKDGDMFVLNDGSNFKMMFCVHCEAYEGYDLCGEFLALDGEGFQFNSQDRWIPIPKEETTMSMSAPKLTETYMVNEMTSLGTVPYNEIEVAFDANLILRLVEEGFIEERDQHHYEAYMTYGGYIIKAEGTELETYFMEMV